MPQSTELGRKHLFQVSFTTNIFEIYDFLLSGYMAVIIGHLFFKTNSDHMAAILSFAVFSSSFIMRIVGGIFWGHFGDKYGSGQATKYSMLIMAAPSCLIGLLPTYNTLGYIATFLLLILRLIQGFGAGGQVPTNLCYVYERTTETKYSSLFCALAASGGWVGSLLASFVTFLLYACYTEKSIYDWAWRIAFLISIPMFVVIFYFRKNIETEHCRVDVVQKFDWVCKEFIQPFIKCFLLLSFMHVCFYMLFVWMPTYLESVLKVAHKVARGENVASLIVATSCVMLWGYFGKHISYKKVMLSSVVLLILFSYPLFVLLHSASFVLLITVGVFFAIIYTPLEGNYVYAVGRAFNSKFRNRGYALSWTLSIAIFGGTTPLICTYFTHLLHFTLFPVVYLICFALITLPAVYLL
ncbi:MAG: sugar transporter family protein [Burkholderiales bacterium]|jgi:MHS family proline/betaine transporter-like MFS transporter|nr:sugar transporter family protein [Burkholderiales bacterium]